MYLSGSRNDAWQNKMFHNILKKDEVKKWIKMIGIILSDRNFASYIQMINEEMFSIDSAMFT